jgi:hypothetical protein
MPDTNQGGSEMEDQDNKKEKPEHICSEHVRYDGGQKINRNGVRIWVETYYCTICGARLDIKEEILD